MEYAVTGRCGAPRFSKQPAHAIIPAASAIHAILFIGSFHPQHLLGAGGYYTSGRKPRRVSSPDILLRVSPLSHVSRHYDKTPRPAQERVAAGQGKSTYFFSSLENEVLNHAEHHDIKKCSC